MLSTYGAVRPYIRAIRRCDDDSHSNRIRRRESTQHTHKDDGREREREKLEDITRYHSSPSEMYRLASHRYTVQYQHGTAYGDDPSG